jgi:hypothetical protein
MVKREDDADEPHQRNRDFRNHPDHFEVFQVFSDAA